MPLPRRLADQAFAVAFCSVLAGSLSLASCGDSSDDDAAGAGSTARGGSSSSGNGGKSGGNGGKGGTSSGAANRGGSTSGGSSAQGGSSAKGGSGESGASSATGGTAGSSAGDGGEPSGATGGTGTGDTGGTSGTSGTAGAPDEMHPAFILHQGICDTYRACCETAGFPDQALEHCEARLDGDADIYRASIEAGRLSIDEDELTSCAGHLRTSYLGCDSVLSLAETFADYRACVDGIAGAVPIGQDCDFDEECVGAGDGRVACMDGVCIDVPLGEDGDRCVETTGPRVVYLVPSSATAGGGAECRRQDGLYCRKVGATDYECAPTADDGDPCDSSEQCGASSYCDETCKPVKDADDACTNSEECGALDCNKDSHTCSTLPDQASCEG